MSPIVRGIGPMIALLVVAGVLIGADEPDQTSKKQPQPSLAPHSSKQDRPSPSPGSAVVRAVPLSADPTSIQNEGSAEEILREARKATEQARQIIVANLANANTPGYKRQIVSFSTVLSGPTPAIEEHPKTVGPQSAQRLGVAMSGPRTDLHTGRIRRTGRPLDLAVEGDGYFSVAPADDEKNCELYCTRCGRFELDKHGHIVLRGLKRDWLVIPTAQVEDPVTKIEITSDGQIYTTVNEIRSNIGQLQLHLLPADCTFTPCGDGVYLIQFNGRRRGYMIGNPGIGNLGELRQGCLEDSNVDPQQELEELQQLQRQAGALEQAAQLLHPAPRLATGAPERTVQ